jgi:hypothetical protein
VLTLHYIVVKFNAKTNKRSKEKHSHRRDTDAVEHLWCTRYSIAPVLPIEKGEGGAASDRPAELLLARETKAPSHASMVP